MRCDGARAQRCRPLLAVGVLLVALVNSCGVPVAAGPRITVMTQNLYVGTGLGDAFAATSWEQLAAAGTRDWATVLAHDFPARARALAGEIARTRPDVVGLQEVSLWRDQTPGDARTHPAPNATHVALDYLAVLLGALRARGVPYTTAATATGADLEFPRQAPGGGLVDLRLTDRDAVIVRSDVARRVGNPRHGHYTAQLRGPFLPGPVTSTRSWESIDYRADRSTTVRIFNTHLEVGDPGTGTVQERQAGELVARIAASPYPVIAIGDFNAPAVGTATPTYRNLTTALHDAWTAVRPADPGWTCCQVPSLADPVPRERVRIDLVLTSQDWPVTRVARIGGRPFRAAPPPVWVSDHLGVTAGLVLAGSVPP
jgi:endonuclease/exonuclease/phosphatase family metal-dependent hydrolase